jgi:hypothetical protein
MLAGDFVGYGVPQAVAAEGGQGGMQKPERPWIGVNNKPLVVKQNNAIERQVCDVPFMQCCRHDAVHIMRGCFARLAWRVDSVLAQESGHGGKTGVVAQGLENSSDEQVTATWHWP